MSDQENFDPNIEDLNQQEKDTINESSEELQTKLNELEIKHQEVSEAFLRARAEIENNRKRALEEEAKARKFAIESFSKGLLAVKDSLEAALKTENQSIESMQEGVETTLKQLKSTFEEHKLQEISPQKGDKLDPHLHQAVAAVPSHEQAPNTIMEVLQKGYTIHDRILRPAMVVVASAT